MKKSVEHSLHLYGANRIYTATMHSIPEYAVRKGDMGMIRNRRGSNMAEAAITMPIVVLVILFALNVSAASYTAIAAAAAANYGARVGAVSREDPDVWAYGAANASIQNSKAGGTIYVSGVQVDKAPGGVVVVTVHWEYPSIMHGLCSLFGSNCPETFEGDAQSAWKKEGW
jgi:Flp pilus assembly protein TadG